MYAVINDSGFELLRVELMCGYLTVSRPTWFVAMVCIVDV